MAIKTITELEAQNFPVLEKYVGQEIDSSEYYKAIAGEEFQIFEDKLETQAYKSPKVVEEASAEAPAKVTKKGKK